MDFLAYDREGGSSSVHRTGTTEEDEVDAYEVEYSSEPGSEVTVSSQIFLPLILKNY